MHVLTKIFVVLVSLMAVLLVPLVVVYAHNEDSYRARYEKADAQAAAARVERDIADSRSAAETNRLQAQLDELTRARASLERDRVEGEAEVRRLESNFSAEQALKAEMNSKLSLLATSVDGSQKLIDGLVNEVRGLRTEVVRSERRTVELDDALRQTSGQLEVAVQARRALQEELQRLKDELATATTKLRLAYDQGFLGRDDVRVGVQDGIAPDVDLQSTVISVRRNLDQTLAEIDAGARDGVKVGWVLSIGRGGDFMGKLRIIEVDVNRSTGVVTLEDPLSSRVVGTGDVAYARAGID